MRENVRRDQHGNPLPGGSREGGWRPLGPDQVDAALGGLPGWQRRGGSLVREFSVEPASHDALRAGIRRAAGQDGDVVLGGSRERLTILLGTEPGDLTSAHLECAARIDTVLSGSDLDRDQA